MIPWRTDIPKWQQGLMRLTNEWTAKEGLCPGREFFDRIGEFRARAKRDPIFYQYLYRMADPDLARKKQRISYAKHAVQRRLDAKRNRERMRNDPVALDKYRTYCREKARVRVATDLNFLLRKKLRTRIGMALKHYEKSASTLELTGCSIDELRLRMEAFWEPGMSWDNYGRNGWHIDHYIPCRRFDLSDPVQQRRCFHYSNLRPMWEPENCGRDNRERKKPL